MLEKFKIKDSIDEYFNERTYYFWKVVGGVFLALSILSGGAMYLMNHADETKTPKDEIVNLSNSDKDSINTLINSFTKDSGTWGSNISKVNNRNITEIIKSVSKNDKNSSKYYTDRITEYKKLRDKYIKANSSLYTTDIAISENWGNDNFARSNMANFIVKDITFTPPSKGTYVLGDKDNFIFTTKVNFTNVQETIQQTGTDSTWNGSYNLVSKTMKNSYDLKLSKVNGVWKVSDASNISTPYPLIFWGRYETGFKFGYENNGSEKIIKQYRYAYDL